MTNRVILGQLGSNYVFKVSRSGINVLTGADDDMMLDTTYPALQIVDSGTLSSPGTNAWTSYVTIPNLGYKPFIFVSCDRYDPRIDYASNTSVRFYAARRDAFVDSGLSQQGISGAIRYFVTNIPLGF